MDQDNKANQALEVNRRAKDLEDRAVVNPRWDMEDMTNAEDMVVGEGEAEGEDGRTLPGMHGISNYFFLL